MLFKDLFGIRWLFAWGKGTTAKENFGAAILIVDVSEVQPIPIQFVIEVQEPQSFFYSCALKFLFWGGVLREVQHG